MNRLKFLAIAILSTFGILFFRWSYLFSNLNKNHKVKNLYVFDEKNNTQNSEFYSFYINNIKFEFNKNAVKNVREGLPSINGDIDLNKFKSFNEFLSSTYNDLENYNNICSGFYLSRSEIFMINNLQ